MSIRLSQLPVLASWSKFQLCQVSSCKVQAVRLTLHVWRHHHNIRLRVCVAASVRVVRFAPVTVSYSAQEHVLVASFWSSLYRAARRRPQHDTTRQSEGLIKIRFVENSLCITLHFSSRHIHSKPPHCSLSGLNTYGLLSVRIHPFHRQY